MRALVKLLFAGIVVILVIAVLFFVLTFEGGPISAVSIEKVNYTPAGYFNLTENDLDKYPVLRELLDEMEAQNKTEIFREVHWKLGGEIHEYMLKRFTEEAGGGGEGVHFKYKGQFYKFRLIVT